MYDDLIIDRQALLDEFIQAYMHYNFIVHPMYVNMSDESHEMISLRAAATRHAVLQLATMPDPEVKSWLESLADGHQCEWHCPTASDEYSFCIR